MVQCPSPSQSLTGPIHVFVKLFIVIWQKLGQHQLQWQHLGQLLQEILWTMYIGAWQSEPCYQHQNPAEWQYQDLKRMVNTILDCTAAPAYCWLLCLMYVSYVLNNCYSENIGSTPLQWCTGMTNDISPMLCFNFMNLSTSLWMIQLSHPRARSIMDVGSELVRMLVTSWLSKFLTMILSRLYTGGTFALHMIQQLRIYTSTCSMRTFLTLVSHSIWKMFCLW